MLLLSKIKTYLQNQHLQLDEDVLINLKIQKQRAMINKDELLANELWCLIAVYKIQEKYLSMFQQLKNGQYEDAWKLLWQIEISIGNLQMNFGDEINNYNIMLINFIIKNYEKVFPEYVYLSRESIVKKEYCSICGKQILLRGGCNHIPGKLYMGELCIRVVKNIKFLGVAIVQNPLDKYAVLKIKGKDYNYQVLKCLMSQLESPFERWYVEGEKRKKPEYKNIGRNDKCPCGSGKKYKKCCLNTQKEYGIHYRITLLGRKNMKEREIKFLGRWVDKPEVSNKKL